jgi:hypothetical protein
MKKPEPEQQKSSGISNRMNDFYFELKHPDGKTEVFGGEEETQEED